MLLKVTHSSAVSGPMAPSGVYVSNLQVDLFNFKFVASELNVFNVRTLHSAPVYSLNVTLTFIFLWPFSLFWLFSNASCHHEWVQSLYPVVPSFWRTSLYSHIHYILIHSLLKYITVSMTDTICNCQSSYPQQSDSYLIIVTGTHCYCAGVAEMRHTRTSTKLGTLIKRRRITQPKHI